MARDPDPRRYRRERPPVVLLGGLNVLRPLGEAGIPVIVATTDPASLALLSRYCDAGVVLPPVSQRSALVASLARLGDQLAGALGSPVPLYYSNDDMLSVVQDCRAELEPRFRLLLNDPDVARAMLEKDRFTDFARERGLPVPRMLQWDELKHFPEPVLVKPKTRLEWDRSAVRLRLFGGKGKARVFPNGWTLCEDPLAQQLRGELAFQEFISGDDRNLWSFHGFAAEDGELLAWFVGRKLRTFPAITGMSSYLELTRECQAELAELGRVIVRRAPVKGVFKMDLKRDPSTGRFRLLEINARYNLWHYPAAKNGLNLPAIAYDYLVHGERPAPSRRSAYGTTVRWLCLNLDVRAYRELSARRELGLAAWLWSLASHRKVYDLFSWSDPLPFLRHATRFGRRAVRLLTRFRAALVVLAVSVPDSARQWPFTAF